MSVKLILTEVVDHLGGPGDIVNVAPGYARNFLLPQRVALEATEGNLRMLENKRKVWKAEEMKEVTAAEQVRDRLAALDVRFERKVGETGTLFGSVTNSDIGEFLAEKGVEIDRRTIVLKSPIKSLGPHDVTVKLHHKVHARLTVTVEPDAPFTPPEIEDPDAHELRGEDGESAEGGEDAAAPAEAPAEAAAESTEEGTAV